MGALKAECDRERQSAVLDAIRQCSIHVTQKLTVDIQQVCARTRRATTTTLRTLHARLCGFLVFVLRGYFCVCCILSVFWVYFFRVYALSGLSVFLCVLCVCVCIYILCV